MLWLDVDTSLLAKPVALDPALDFMGRRKPKGDHRTWHVDAMYFNATTNAKTLIGLWISFLADHSDEHAFNELWRAGVWSGHYGALPAAYDDAPGSIVRYGRSISDRKAADMAMLKARR